MSSKLSRLAFIGGITALTALMISPYHNGALRYGLPLSLLAIWGSLLVLLWRRPRWRVVLFGLPLLALVPFCLPSKPIDRVELRSHYVAAMEKMGGLRYIWGGESHRGIDCSGLPRRGLRDALLEEGFRHGNGAGFREWARQWWFDTSAKAMGEGYRDFTRPTGISGKLSLLDFSRLQPGDLAVTEDGRHVMIFLGDKEWIQADPQAGKVIIGKPESDPNIWFDANVSIHRWRVLE